jgi:hypothetical protein
LSCDKRPLNNRFRETLTTPSCALRAVKEGLLYDTRYLRFLQQQRRFRSRASEACSGALLKDSHFWRRPWPNRRYITSSAVPDSRLLRIPSLDPPTLIARSPPRNPKSRYRTHHRGFAESGNVKEIRFLARARRSEHLNAVTRDAEEPLRLRSPYTTHCWRPRASRPVQ